jgi:hypothetical protein
VSIDKKSYADPDPDATYHPDADPDSDFLLDEDLYPDPSFKKGSNP